VGSDLRGARGDLWLARKLVGELPHGGHAQAMLSGGRSQCRIPLERPGAGLGASLIGQLYDLPCLRLNGI